MIVERSQLARLRADEQNLERRRLNVQNFGSTWLKPPGVTKTLHQIREEKREQEEHQEALRREQLAQELADAEAGGDGLLQGEGMDDVQLDGARDLDDDIPDADADEFGADEEDEDEEVAAEEDEDAHREERRNDLIAQRMRMTDDAFREALARGDGDGEDIYGADEELDEEQQAHMLDEDDFITMDERGADQSGLDMDMDANLDDDIPEAESGLYEHTDSEAEISSSSEEEDEPEISFAAARRAAPLAPPQSPLLRSSAPRPAGPRNSMDLSSILSADESSSPQRRMGQ
jgi:hypothetical protein